MISTFPELIPQDIKDIDGMIKQDVYNNSAWNQRFFLLKYERDTSVEVSWVIEKIRLAPRNEAAWNYLKGFVVLAG